MTFEIATLLVLLAVATVLLSLERLSVDVVALGVVATLIVTGVLEPAEAFAGLGSEIIVILAAIFVLSGILDDSGVLGGLGDTLVRRLGASRSRSVAGVMALSAGISGFISNTTTTAVLLPAVLQLGRRTAVGAGRLLLPLAYASMLGGTCTLIGTSTNLAASGLLERLGQRPIGLFELTAVGVPVVVVGILYMALVGYRLLPDRVPRDVGEAYHIDDYLAEMVIAPGSPLAGRSIASSHLGERGLQVLALVRHDRQRLVRPSARLREGDVLIVQARREALLDLDDSALRLGGSTAHTVRDLVDSESLLIEAIVTPGSGLAGRTLRECRFRQRYGASVLAVARGDRQLPTGLADLRLHTGDVLLLLTSPEHAERAERDRDLWTLGRLEATPKRRRRGWLALAALGAAITLGASGVLPLSVALLVAALVVVVVGGIGPDAVYRFVEWRLLVLVGGMTALGTALQKTGAAHVLADALVRITLPLGTWMVLAALVVLTMALTQPMSNAAAALVVLPIAVATAEQLAVDPRAVAILVTLSASLSFIAPLEPACLLVYGPGRYRFRDFVLAGLPLTALVVVLLLVLVPLRWPL